MVRIDNDRTKGLAQPFLILAHVRTGGTFCAHALSNHPQIFCDRGETLHHLSAWHRAEIPVKAMMEVIWNQDGYHAAGFRAIYRQALHRKIWPFIQEKGPKIIHLTRRDVARQGISFGYQQLVRMRMLPYHPVHTFEEIIPEPVRVDPAVIVAYANEVRNEMAMGREILAGYKGEVLEIAYEDMVAGGLPSAIRMAVPVAHQIEDFLGVRHYVLTVDLKCDMPLAVPDWFKNWPEIRRALKQAGFGGWGE